jgi:hypothetical protein
VSSTSDVLAAIESKCFWIKADANELVMCVARLPFRHEFETKAEAAMDDAERELIEALKAVRKSRAAYHAKQVERQHAA